MSFHDNLPSTPRFKDSAKNAFVKTNLFYTKNPFLGIQDPTVFGFKLFFHFDTPSSPLLYGAVGDITEAPLNTAANYLKSIGDQQRLYYLSKFVYLLSSINSQTPWYFQTITGLKEAWKHDFTKPYIGDDKRLDIDCAESVDLRVTALMDYYRKACFDWKYRREVVPKNLRQFKLSIYVYEARVFNNPNALALFPFPLPPLGAGYGGNIQGQAAVSNAKLVQRLTGPDETENDPITENVNTILGTPMSTSRNIFHFDFCEFDMSDGAHLDGLTNTEPSEVKQKIGITYGDVEEDNMYNFWDLNSVSDGYITSLDKLALDDPAPGEPPTLASLPPIVSAVTSLQGNGADLLEQAKKLALGLKIPRLTALYLGNVYGISAATLAGAAGQQSVKIALRTAGNSLLNANGKSDASGNINEGPPPTNVTGKPPIDNTSYGASLTNAEGSISGNVYDGPPPTNSTGKPPTENNSYGPSLLNKDKPNSPNSNIYEK